MLASLFSEIQGLAAAQRETNRNLELIRESLLATSLGDTEIALNIFQVIGVAERASFADSGSVVAAATRTFTIAAPPGSIGLIETLNVDVSLSQAFRIIIDFDGKVILDDQAVVGTDINLPTQWFPFFNEFRVRMINNDPLSQRIKIQGPRTFMREDEWRLVRRALEGSLRMVLGR